MNKLTDRTVREYLGKLSKWIIPYWPAMTLGTLMGLGQSMASVYIAAMQQKVIATMKAGNLDALYSNLIHGGIFIVGCVLIGSVGGVLKGYLKAKIARGFRLDTFDHVNRLPMAKVDAMHSGDLVSRASDDASKATQALTSGVFDAFDIASMMILAFVYLARINAIATIAAACTGPIIFLSGRFFDKGIRERGEALQKNQAELRKFLQDDIQGSSVVSAYRLEEEMTRRFSELRKESKRLNLKQSLAWSGMYQVGGFMNTLATIGCATVVTVQAIHGNSSPGAVLAFVILVNRVTFPVIGLSRVWGGVQEGLGSAKRVFEILDMPVEGPGKAPAIKLLGRNMPALEISDVSFSYATREDVLTDVSLRVGKGEMVAVVGPSGSGKSTLAKLALGLYLPAKGTIKVNGSSTRDELDEARAASAYVPQTPHIFSASLKENVTLAWESATDGEIRDAIGKAGLTEVIDGLKDGLDTAVGEKGVNFSGGQKQRIAVARAFMRHAPLVVLDEATSALDNETEAYIQDSIERMKKDSGLLVIAHRLTTVMNADRIVVLEEGRITEEGTHGELLELGGTYAKLWSLSQREQVEGGELEAVG